MSFFSNLRSQKYISDILINPGKLLALGLHVPNIIIAGCVLFAISETIHCSAHIRGAWQKKRSGAWKATKIAIIAGRLLASLAATAILTAVTIIGSLALITTLMPIFVILFVAASCFSAFHKIRGLIDHLRKPTTPGLMAHIYHFPRYIKNLRKNRSVSDEEKAMNTTFALTLRAGIGMMGAVLSFLIVAKVAFVVAIISNPIGFGLGCVILGGMMMQKIWKTHQHRLGYIKKHDTETKSINNTIRSSTIVENPKAKLIRIINDKGYWSGKAKFTIVGTPNGILAARQKIAELKKEMKEDETIFNELSKVDSIANHKSRISEFKFLFFKRHLRGDITSHAYALLTSEGDSPLENQSQYNELVRDWDNYRNAHRYTRR